MKESFVFFRSFFEAIEEIDEKKQLKLYKSIAKFALNDEKPTNLKGIEKAIFALIEPQITANNKRFEVSKKCGEYGKLGGRPKKEKTLKGFENETLNVNVNDNVNDNVNVNDKDLKTPPSKKEILNYVHSLCKKIDIDNFVNYYEASNWKDKEGLPINWKQKALYWANTYKEPEEDIIDRNRRIIRELEEQARKEGKI